MTSFLRFATFPSLAVWCLTAAVGASSVGCSPAAQPLGVNTAGTTPTNKAPARAVPAPAPVPRPAPRPEVEHKPSAPKAARDASKDAPTAPKDKDACPSDMVLVAGDYCSDVKHDCVKEWYAEVNKKRVCEEFAPHSECIGTKSAKRFCIDKYSWPNMKGTRPEVMNNFYQAQVKCAAVGKRLCTESEWTMACEGPEMLPFPYGYVRDATKCNGDREWDNPDMVKVAKRDPEELARLWQGVPSGSQPECVSGYGVHDMPGNTDDIAQSETTGPGFRGKYDSVTTGGPWYKGVRNQCRPKIYTHDEGFYYYYLGFRCCAEPDGATTDPRGPKQIARGWDFERIERLARFTREEMKRKLELKAAGKCECSEKDVLCKTMCGTLLGPGAKDADLDSPRGKEEPSAGTKPAQPASEVAPKSGKTP